ncbi:MAG: 16S rRNA (adenine(1518)-N(6)/adenine(1519)-N(6))-dimethyltransferase RsmA [Thermodesulfobacteriota bacterium]
MSRRGRRPEAPGQDGPGEGRSTVREVLDRQGLAPSRRLGQNFLVHPGLAQRIVDQAGIEAGDLVVELGVGLGALTNLLAARAHTVVGLEIDAGLVRWHQEAAGLAANVRLLHADLLHFDLASLAAEEGRPLKIVANLPYSVSSPFLFRLLDLRSAVAWAVIMLQKEVATRLAALPGSRDYGILSVLLGACARVQTLFTVGAAHFHPRPRVDSAVVRVTFLPPPPAVANLPLHDPDWLRAVVKAAFGQRRKTLANALSAGLGLERSLVEEATTGLGWAGERRAQELGVAEFVRLANALAPHRPVPGRRG